MGQRNRVTIRDVAAQAGVSLGTASNVLNSPLLVADETRRRVEEAIEELGFVRDGVARQLRARRSFAIGLVMFDVANPLFAQVARCIEDAVSEEGLLVILCDAAGSAERERRHLRLLEENRVGGIILTTVEDSEPDAIEALRERGVGIVRLGVPGKRRDRCSVSDHHRHGGKLAAEHLLELGHRRIAMIGGSRSFAPNVGRRAGFVARLAAAGIELDPRFEVEAPAMTVAHGEALVRALFATRSQFRPTALFCLNDLLALGAMRGLIALGLRVPGDVAVIGYDDIPFADMSTVPLTSIRMQTEAMARMAVKLLLEEIGGEHRHKRVVLKPELIPRQSTVGSAGGE